MVKDDEVRNISDEKAGLQEKIESLLDLLYGCNACGLCDCECSDSAKEDEDCDSSLPQYMSGEQPSSPSPDTPSQTPAPPPRSNSSPWTPPPTPPCTTCGRVNFGPCPSNVCFACIPPLECQPEPTGSPSRTPPGTPPLLGIEQRATRTRPGEGELYLE